MIELMIEPNEPLPDQLLSVLGGVEEEEEEHRGDDMSEMDGPNPGHPHQTFRWIIVFLFQAPLITLRGCFIQEFPAKTAPTVIEHSKTK